jgi:hypothetical protein
MRYKKIQLLVARQWEENKWSYTFGIMATCAVLGLLFVVTWHWRDSFAGDVKHGIFLLGLLGGGSIYCSSLFRKLENKSRAVWFICLPASAAEKLFVALLYVLVLYPLVYTAVFYVTEGFFSWVVQPGTGYAAHTDLLHNKFYLNIFVYTDLQLMVLLGSIYFKKTAFVKTVLVCIAGFVALNNLNMYLLQWMTGRTQITSAFPFDYFQFEHNGEHVYVHLPQRVNTITCILLDGVKPALLCCCCYLRLKETEI